MSKLTLWTPANQALIERELVDAITLASYRMPDWLEPRFGDVGIVLSAPGRGFDRLGILIRPGETFELVSARGEHDRWHNADWRTLRRMTPGVEGLLAEHEIEEIGRDLI